VIAATASRQVGRTDPTPLARLERMSPEQRLRAYRSGAMTRTERSAWAASFPEEVPLVNDEYEWLVRDLE
jgi:hypothetical protein